MQSRADEEIKAMYRDWLATIAADPQMPLERMREIFDHWGDVTAEPRGVDYLEVDANGVEAMWAVPRNAREDRVLLCTHGGGYVVGSMYSHRKLFGHIAKAVGCRALIVHFRRAPENLHPGPVNDVVRAYSWLLESGISPGHIAFTGDSAGGGLAVTTMLLARDKGLPLPVASMPISPWLDMDASDDTYETNKGNDVLVSREIIRDMAAHFLGPDGNPTDPYANPLAADLSGLPPLLVQVGGDEALLGDSRKLAKKAQAAGVDVTLEEYPKMQHVFHFLAGRGGAADTAIGRMASWVKPKLGL